MTITYNLSLINASIFIGSLQVLFFVGGVFGTDGLVRLVPIYSNSSLLKHPQPRTDGTYISDVFTPSETSERVLELNETSEVDIHSTLIDSNGTDLLSQFISNVETEDSTRPFGLLEKHKLSEEEINNEVDRILNSTMKISKKGKLEDTLLNIRPNIEERFQDASQSKCYILAVTGGGAKGAYSSGAMNGLALRYRLLGVKLRWDVVSGISIGALNTIWKQFYLPTQSAHFTTEGASIWNFFSKKNVHTCKDDVKISTTEIVKLLKILNIKKGYLCSSNPISFFMRHIVQNRRRFKGSHWSVLAFNYKVGLHYLFNEETPISLLPSVVRASSSFPIILEPTKIEGLGIFGDGSIVKAINIQGAINRCFQTGKAKTDNDVVIDIISTSLHEDEHIFTFDPKESKTLLEVISWFLYYYYLTPTFQHYEIVQTIRRYPGVKFRHYITFANDKNSVVKDMSVFGFDIKQMVTALNEGFSTGFNSADSFADTWKLKKKGIEHSGDWKPYNDGIVTIPKSDKFVSNPDTDAFVDFPTLVEVNHKEPLLSHYRKLFLNNAIFSGENIHTSKRKESDKIFRESFRRKLSTFILTLHSHLLSIRHTEITKEFVRNREYMKMSIYERERDVKRRMEYNVKESASVVINDKGNISDCGAKCTNVDPKVSSRMPGFRHNADTRPGSKGHDLNSDDSKMKELNDIPFFQAARQYITSLRTSYTFAYDLVSLFSSKEGKRKYRSILKSERKMRMKLEESSEISYKLVRALADLYNKYDELMKPLNDLHSSLIKLTKDCKYESTWRNPLLFPFLEGEDSSQLIWAPSEEYNGLLEEYHVKSLLTLANELYPKSNPNINFSLKLEENKINHANRLEQWRLYQQSISNYIDSDESLCWLKNEDIKNICKNLEVTLFNMPYIKAEHFKLVTDITDIHIILTRQQIIPRFYTASIERLLRKKAKENLHIIQQIQLRANLFDNLPSSQDGYPTKRDVSEGENSYIKRIATESLDYVTNQ
ncbi:secreted of the alpha beta hydrolase superfamily [Cryptosporidium bovis]|uniref:secreted of the alpha beta hydrolase superfamily n=1 Tax=Cryptosporidium bovis TaxID=310047 RepID=UPI003519F3F5|nr:secreted of the alpha beta hydrolase superfamily [Cryptosporidium bovis]